MKGMELARGYYGTWGAPMIRAQFPEYEEIIAAALTGSGSECFGFDDEISRDHDFEPGFCLFLPGEDIVDRSTAFRLERAYAKLPAEFEGFRRQKMGPVGGHRHGVFRLEEYFTEKIGCPAEEMTMDRWLRTPEYALAEAVNGQIFRDDAGLLTDCRQALMEMPEDARRKRLAGRIFLMAQSGQYNYRRCLAHGERGAARLAAAEFVQNALSALFLLQGRYMPYYKWSFRAARELPEGRETAARLEMILAAGQGEAEEEETCFRIEEIASDLISMLQARGWTAAVCGDLEKHAYSINDSIRDGEIRNLHILYCG